MKIVFLLALAGLASCRSILPGGDRARNVELEYTYIDETGKPIRVKVQSDLINLSGVREVESKEPEPRFVQFAPRIQEVDFKINRPEPVVKHVFVPAPAAPEPEFRFVVQHPEPKTIEVEVPKPEVHTIYVQAPAPIPFGRNIELKTPEPKVVYVQAPEPKTVEVEVDVPVQQLHRFVVPAPSTRTVKFEAPKPVVQHFILPTHRTLQTNTPSIRRVSLKKSFHDDDDLGSAEK